MRGNKTLELRGLVGYRKGFPRPFPSGGKSLIPRRSYRHLRGPDERRLEGGGTSACAGGGWRRKWGSPGDILPHSRGGEYQENRQSDKTPPLHSHSPLPAISLALPPTSPKTVRRVFPSGRPVPDHPFSTEHSPCGTRGSFFPLGGDGMRSHSVPKMFSNISQTRSYYPQN